MTTSTKELIQGTVVVLRDCLDHLPLPESVGDDVLEPHAARLFKQARAGDSELALRSAVGKIQLALRLPVADHRCRDVVSRVSDLTKIDASDSEAVL
jgi:hypothetical protein